MRREGIFLRAVDPAPGKIAPNYDEILTNLGAVMYRAEVAEAENLRLRELLATYQSKGTDS